MSLDEMNDDVALAPDNEPAVDRTAAPIRRNLAHLESSLTEFDRIAEGLAALHKAHPADLVFDVSTTKGMAEAVAHRAAWRDPRIAVEKYRKAAKAPVIALGKDIDARATWLTEQLLIGETPVHEQIKAEEARKAQERADREAAEFGRVMAMQEAVGEIAMSAMVNGQHSTIIADKLRALREQTLDPKVYQEMMPQAEAARTAALAKLEQAIKAAQWDEAEAQRKSVEAGAALAAQIAADKERARISAEQASEAKRLQEARDMIAKADREAREQMEAERKKLAAEKAAWLAEQEAAKPKPVAAPAPVVATVGTAPAVSSPAAPAPAAPVDVQALLLAALRRMLDEFYEDPLEADTAGAVEQAYEAIAVAEAQA